LGLSKNPVYIPFGDDLVAEWALPPGEGWRRWINVVIRIVIAELPPKATGNISRAKSTATGPNYPGGGGIRYSQGVAYTIPEKTG